MIQLILKIISIGCGIGGQYFAPFIMAALNIPGYLLCFLPLCLLATFAFEPNFINSSNGKDKNTARTSMIVCSIYYVICVTLMCSLFQTVCRSASSE